MEATVSYLSMLKKISIQSKKFSNERLHTVTLCLSNI